jgi:hypothetical protein
LASGPAPRPVRLQLGYRFAAIGGRLSVEGLATRAGLIRDQGSAYDFTQLGLAAKYNLPIADSFEAYGRAGLQTTSLDIEDGDSAYNYGGGGFLVGAGLEYRLSFKLLGGASVFVDYTIARTTLDTMPESGMTTRVWTLGAALAF